MIANSESLKNVVSSLLAEPIQSLSAVAGVDICNAFRAVTQNGKYLFIKTHPHPPPEFFEAESRGLGMLQKTRTLAVPTIRAVISEPELKALILEWVEPGPVHPHTSEDFGHRLAMLHRSPAPYFGFDTDNYIGTLKQPNAVSQNWIEFFTSYRISPQINWLNPMAISLDRFAPISTFFSNVFQSSLTRQSPHPPFMETYGAVIALSTRPETRG